MLVAPERFDRRQFRTMNEIATIRSRADLDRLWNSSHQKPVFLLKHSLVCGTSHAALETYRSFADSLDSPQTLALLEIQPHRDLSNEVAERAKVRHQSPQVLLIIDGSVVWSRTHWSIQKTGLEKALEQYSPAAWVAVAAEG